MPRSGADVNSCALIFGLAAAICLLIPVIGEGLAVLPALTALVLGFLTVRRHETDRTVRGVAGDDRRRARRGRAVCVGVAMFLMTDLVG